MTRVPINEGVLSDIHFGFRMAKAIGDLDIGQTVVVKNGIVLAVEAIEGTDQAILRGGALGQGGAVVVKVSKPKQDLRFDMPTIGPVTINHCIQAGIKAIAIEAGSTILLDSKEVIRLAEENGIDIISL
ncbi:MAG: LpxI family protein [Candidatus Cloacimonetes bacterium]|nr:LpxI family protein [Candidatus Cloacimonadota bacterium]